MTMSVTTQAPPAAVRRSPLARLTLVELIVTVAILAILAAGAAPVARYKVKREKERELHYQLWTMRDAIDKYKDAADKGYKTKVVTMSEGGTLNVVNLDNTMSVLPLGK